MADLDGSPADAVDGAESEVVHKLDCFGAVYVHIEGEDAGASEDKSHYVPGDALA